jgi:hypothetical protein
MHPTTLVLTFDSALDERSAVNPLNYRITDWRNRPIGVKNVTYDSASRTVTIQPVHQLNVHYRYHLTVVGSSTTGVKGRDGASMDAATGGTFGSDYSASIDLSSLADGPKSRGK